MHASNEIPSDAFIEGFLYELSNRAFAMRVAERLSKRLKGEKQEPFWLAYLRLEQLNAPYYRAAALGFGLNFRAGWWIEIKAWAISLVPRSLMKPALESAHSKTVEYVGELRELRRIGPASSQDFLSYMVAQEELQVEMMQLALRGEYAKLVRRVDGFIRTYNGGPFFPEK
ncbi:MULTISPECIES: hypothetical protein [unclassified Variovorax]|uniref:hypothetical protein n=1 Tax=unclassified Variovorax TaxID=663243 RepID=UPI0032E6A913